jgi:hypothetical protein
MPRKITIPALILAVTALCAILAVTAYRRSRSLLDNATEIRISASGGRLHNYTWIDNHTYLTTSGSYPETQLLKVDTRSGTESVCANFSLPPAMMRFRIRPAGIPASVPGTLSPWLHAGVVSPDGAKALWNSTDGWQLVDFTTGKARSLGTGTASNVPNPRNPAPMENATWMPNSRDWVSVVWYFNKPSTLTIRDSSGRILSTGPVGRTSGMPYVLGVLPGDVVLLHDFQRVYTVDTRHGFATRFRDETFPDDGWFVQDAALSPDRRRIVWSCEKRTDWPRIPGPLGRIAPSSPVTLVSAIFTSDSDGGNLREVGRYSRMQTSRILDSEHIYDVAWLPDGRHISFNYRDRLWTMPVDAR